MIKQRKELVILKTVYLKLPSWRKKSRKRKTVQKHEIYGTQSSKPILARLRKKEISQKNTNERKDITTDTTELKRIIKAQYE